jgi:hypothetical protein
MPTSVLFIAAAPGGGGCELVPPGCAFIADDDPSSGGELVVPAGAGVDPCGAMPTSVFFIAAAEGEAAFIALEEGFGRGGLSVAPQTPHVAVSGFAGDPQRGQTLMRADYFVSAKRHGPPLPPPGSAPGTIIAAAGARSNSG